MVSQFEIKSSDGSSISGGRPIVDREARLNTPRYWIKSSYLTEVESAASSAYVYVYSFSADPIRALQSGARLNSYKFTGQELLNLTFPSALASASTLEVYAYAEYAVEHNSSGIKVIQ